MALQLSLRPKNPKSLTNPSLIHLFSSNSSAPSDPNDEPVDTSSSASNGSAQSPMSSYFSDVKARLKQQQQSPSPPSARKPSYPFTSIPNRSSSPASKAASLEEIRKNLSEFRSRSSVPPPSELGSTPSSSASSSWQRGISFQELYKRNAMRKGEDGNAPADSTNGGRSSMLPFDSIRESLRRASSSRAMQNERKSGDSMSLSAFKNSLKLKPSDPSSTPVFGGTERLPASVFGKEMRDRKDGENEGMKTEFVKMYSHGELGSKLRALRPEKAKGKNWFSLTELNERLMKLRAMEEKETESKIGGISFQDLRQSLVKMKITDDEKAKKTTIQRLDILGQIGRTPNYMLQPPKEHLVEKYFHTDNMSSAEKLKIELTKVRDEFKMSESDCGSARVQVAQLTTKINHLTAVLHKKDKHSKKGLLAMVQLRKKLLKYLRRTDWESYCLVLNKLGLRDNPDYKN